MLTTLSILPLPAPSLDRNHLGSLSLSASSQVSDNIQLNVYSNPTGLRVASIPTHTKTIGIIYPPLDIRNIADKTAQFVANNGLNFERKIIANNAGNAKFNFLNISDPYNAYYQHRLSEFRTQVQPTPIPQAGDLEGSAAVTATVTKSDLSAQFRSVCKVLEPPESEHYTVRLLDGITSEELDIIKLTAQFVAQNGSKFWKELTTREVTNPQFQFLKPTHSMSKFFTSLVDVYSRVLMPPKGLSDKLRRSVADITTVYEHCLNRLEWEQSQEQARQKAEDEVEYERMQMAMIDWQDFVVVEQIEFADDEDEELPSPMTLEEVIRRGKASAMEEDLLEVIETGNEADMEMDEEEVQLVQEGMKASIFEENDEEKTNERITTATEEPEASMRIVKNWKRPEERVPAERDPRNFVVSPITRELIPINEMAEHMRISLIDPKYKEQKERMMAKIRETTLAQDDEISTNIVGLARTRPDIFGTTEEEVSNAVKAEIEKKKEEQPKQVIWDGHTESIGRTANQAMSQNIFREDQTDAANNESRGFPGASAPPPRHGMPSVRPLPPPPGLSPNMPHMFLPNGLQYTAPTGRHPGHLQPSLPMMTINASVRPPPPPILMTCGQQTFMMRPPPLPLPQSISTNLPNIPVQPPPGSQFTPPSGPRSFTPYPIPEPSMNMIPPPPLPQGMLPPPPEEAPPSLPDEPKPKRQRVDDSSLIPEDQFLAQNQGPVCITISVPNVNEGNLKGQLLEIPIQSLSETISSVKEKIAGEVQLPANKQKLSGQAGFLKDNVSLAYYNIGAGETLTLVLRERGGRKK
ncbi:hypothetical protein AQUCO_01100304v1 [Aquilegia coerulea]|uniref:Ubiquitin-like domain-containing protein n=1 Tax=Aquilegia coerulea TaxID=218851 RepID=A0A2G5E6I9_AQUCA|nr:hypothetical protein AQUCO_01100304v1 [Aquilegia coerulea]